GGGAAAHRGRLLHPGGRRAALHLAEDRQEPPRVDLPEARRAGPHPGRAAGRAHGDRAPRLRGAMGPSPALGRTTYQERHAGADTHTTDLGGRGSCTNRQRSTRDSETTEMITSYHFIKAWLVAQAKTERGASLVEYALLVALIAVFCIGAMTFLRSEERRVGKGGRARGAPGQVEARRLE